MIIINVIFIIIIVFIFSFSVYGSNGTFVLCRDF